MARRNEVDILIKARDQASRKLNQVDKVSNKLDDTFKKLAVSAGAFFSVAAIGAVASKTIKAASDLKESQNAVNVVFAEGAEIVLKFGENAATAAGLATAEFNQLSAMTGALLKDTGLAMTTVAEKTNILAVRAADMASVMNTTVQDALSAVNQALRGETEAIRRYTGDVTDASLQQFLLSQGIDKTVTKMTEQEKRLGRLSLIMAQTDKFAGDFANTNKELANQQRIAAANIENFAAKIGQTFLPVISDGINLFNEFITTITESDFDKAIRKLEELGDATDFIEVLRLNRAIREEAGKRLEVAEKIRSFEREELVIADIKTGKQTKFHEGLQVELNSIIEIVKHTKDISKVNEFLAKVEDKRRGNLKAITASYDEGLDVNIAHMDLLTGMDLSLTNISNEAARFLTLLNEEKTITEAINSLLQDRAETSEEITETAKKELEIRTEQLNIRLREDEVEKLKERLQHQQLYNDNLEKEFEIRNDIKDLTVEQILAENEAFVVLNEFGPALARAAVEGKNLSEVIERMVDSLKARGLLGLIGAAIGFGFAGAAGARAGFNLGFGSPVFNAQHGDEGVFPGQGDRERPYWGMGSPGEHFEITPRPKTVSLNVAGGGESFNMTKSSFRRFMREIGYDVIINDTEFGKGL